MKKRFLFTLLLCLFSTQVFAQLKMEQFLTNQALVKLGETSFQKRCSGCHGMDGTASTASPFLDPKPRNLTSGIFKFRSTPNGELPTDQDLMRTITQGVLGTSMPSFRFVPESERMAIVNYIKTLSPAWKNQTQPIKAVMLHDAPDGLFTKKDTFLKHAKAGKEIFAGSCALCHGYDGRGHGPSADSLLDEWNNPIKPIDFTKPFIKSGWGAEDIYRVLSTGLNGTPMAVFRDALGEEKTWDVIAYVMYLRGEAAGVYEKGTISAITPPPLEPASN